MKAPMPHSVRSPRAAPLMRVLALTLLCVAAGTRVAPAQDPQGGVAEITGSVIALNWSDPIVELSVLGSDGAVWLIRTSSIRSLAQFGIAPQLLSIGTPLTVAGRPMAGDRVLRATHLLLARDREIVLQRGAPKRWTGAAR